MANPERLVTTVSTKGQVTLPSAIRKRRLRGAGTRLLVEDTPEGVCAGPCRNAVRGRLRVAAS
ncbi:hypothetical protein MES5069_30248 [Mesorhizobium escarrei]|uniref:AbrB/MazE/SpoVT family DNA-binding domain-containing protein n=1 Tax=Mesorhizobium escarrei TaxID=666018 RepID=A0ABM9E0B8_9HYPH|nr:hypothetical protein MES5069_30248 [Mesorhizobium escarrei]